MYNQNREMMRSIVERYSLRDAQVHLKELIEEAQQGKTIVILDEHEGAVQLIPVNPRPGVRRAGSARGQIHLAPDFDEPLADFADYVE
jgi:antitoxin (DNA-binding transcriptional repressor) of toxin-antitoxin stability system